MLSKLKFVSENALMVSTSISFFLYKFVNSFTKGLNCAYLPLRISENSLTASSTLGLDDTKESGSESRIRVFVSDFCLRVILGTKPEKLICRYTLQI